MTTKEQQQQEGSLGIRFVTGEQFKQEMEELRKQAKVLEAEEERQEKEKQARIQKDPREREIYRIFNKADKEHYLRTQLADGGLGEEDIIPLLREAYDATGGNGKRSKGKK